MSDITRANRFTVTVTTHSHEPRVDIALKKPGSTEVWEQTFEGGEAKERALRWAYDALYRYSRYPTQRDARRQLAVLPPSRRFYCAPCGRTRLFDWEDNEDGGGFRCGVCLSPVRIPLTESTS